MTRKLVSFLCCFLPVSAVAAVIDSGSGVNYDEFGLVLSGDVFVGVATPGTPDPNNLYITTGTTSSFSMQSLGDIDVGGELQISSGRGLTIVANKAANPTAIIDVGFGGAIENFGTLKIGYSGSGSLASVIGMPSEGVRNFSAGAVDNKLGGTLIVNVSNDITINGLVNNGAALLIGNDLVSADTVQNLNAAATMDIVLAGDMDITGNLENHGAWLGVNANDVTISGGMNNAGSSMKLLVNNLSVMGGEFVNVGDFTAVVTGDTYLKNGFNISTMALSGTFSLHTGTLDFGISQALSNHLNLFELIVDSGDVTFSGISNDAGAEIYLQAPELYTGSVKNEGIMNISATDNNSTPNGIIVINEGLTNSAGAVATIVSANELSVNGGTSNAGDLTLNGIDVNLGSVANSGNSLKILGRTDIGTVTVNGGLVNDGNEIRIEGREITVTGQLRNNGTGVINVVGSDYSANAISLGSISAAGGRINLDSKIGDISVVGTVVVDGGSLNFSANTHNLSAGGSITIGNNLTASNVAATGVGNVNVSAAGVQKFMLHSDTGIYVGGSVYSVGGGTSQILNLDSVIMDIAGNVTAANSGMLIFGDNRVGTLTVLGDLRSYNGGVIDLDVSNANLRSLSNAAGVFSSDGKIIARGDFINVSNIIDIKSGIKFINGADDNLRGLIIKDTDKMTIEATNAGIDVNVAGGISVASGKELVLKTKNQANISGEVNIAGTSSTDGILRVIAESSATFANTILNSGIITVNAHGITTANITNNAVGTLDLISTDNVNVGMVQNSGSLTLNGLLVTARSVETDNGWINVITNLFKSDDLSITGGFVNMNTSSIDVIGDISVAGNVVQGGATGMLNLLKNNTIVTSENLRIGGDLIAVGNKGTYDIDELVNVTGSIIVLNDADVSVESDKIITGGINNASLLKLTADYASLGDVVNSGALDIYSGTNNDLMVDSITTTDGFIRLYGSGLRSSGTIKLSGDLSQSKPYDDIGDLRIMTAGDYSIKTTKLDVDGDIYGDYLKISEYDTTNWLTVDVGGSITGGANFFGLKSMTVGGLFRFENDSMINAVILPKSGQNYWSSVSLVEDGTLGQITNSSSGEPLISINGNFVSAVDTFGNGLNGVNLDGGQIGITIFDTIDQGTAIWLLQANEIKMEAGAQKLRNLFVKFCNADGSSCYNYLDSFGAHNGSETGDDLPIYLSMRDADGDGEPDSLYVVFDPRFGGPVKMFKIQPIVDYEPDSTSGEYYTAGAIDNLIEDGLKKNLWSDTSPIEVVPLIFKNTIMEDFGKELYVRMEQYLLNMDGSSLARFSRVFQPRELDQIVGSISLNEYTNSRDLERHLVDEFIWNRHRNLEKFWIDADLGTIRQNSDDMVIKSNRFSIFGGYDWQKSETLIMGLSVRASQTTGNNSDIVDVKYKLADPILANVNLDVTNTNIGFGGYFMQTLDTKSRMYGNLFFDLHMLNVSRDQAFIGATIEGSGNAISVVSEWGYLHDWLNQYIVGNLYARAGYNFGFTINESAGRDEYMNLQSDGFFILTPGYSLTAQKRIYPSSWLQVRPHASIGVEYNVLGVPDMAQFKFAQASKFSDYAVNIDPLWTNIGGGIEVLSASGWQMSLGYRYQFNPEIQMHDIRLGGSYRF